MPRRTDDYHGGGSGWRFSWRIDRLQKMHELGRAFGMTEDANDFRPESEPQPDIQPGSGQTPDGQRSR